MTTKKMEKKFPRGSNAYCHRQIEEIEETLESIENRLKELYNYDSHKMEHRSAGFFLERNKGIPGNDYGDYEIDTSFLTLHLGDTCFYEDNWVEIKISEEDADKIVKQLKMKFSKREDCYGPTVGQKVLT